MPDSSVSFEPLVSKGLLCPSHVFGALWPAETFRFASFLGESFRGRAFFWLFLSFFCKNRVFLKAHLL